MWRTAGAALVASAWTFQVLAGQASAPFAVKVDLQTTRSTGLCKSSELADRPELQVLVVCSTDPGVERPVPKQTRPWDYRFSIPLRIGDLNGNVDLYSGAGTITSWRMVRLSNREYLEMTVGW